MARVTAIRPVGVREVFDIEVPGNHNFVANGMVVHNCHRLGAEQFSTVASMFPARLRLALSATTERVDGKELIVHAHIGPVRVRGTVEQMVPRVMRFESGWRVPMIPRRDRDTGLMQLIQLPHRAGKTGAVLKHLIKDGERNRMLAELVLVGHEKHRNVVFFSDALDHLNTVIRLCKEMGIDPKAMGKFVGGQDLSKVEDKPIIFATFGMMAEGTNIPRLDYGVMGTPRAAVNQPVGRIRREAPGKPAPIWMDVVDRDSPVFNSYSAKRLVWYRSIGCSIEDH